MLQSVSGDHQNRTHWVHLAARHYANSFPGSNNVSNFDKTLGSESTFIVWGRPLFLV
uniref:Uncharacterized protein n=1 Tax=Picea glauca TaxID=3330 RepID=A0A101M5I6_PICGL|nr:hypothetical protein ABT39_MTgene1099 [Picea glauca]